MYFHSLFDFQMLLVQEPKSAKESDNVRVVVRCRPMNGKEKQTGCKQTVDVSSTSPEEFLLVGGKIVFSTQLYSNCDIMILVSR